MAKIEKCPWCGSDAIINFSHIGYFVECSKNGHVHNVGCFGFDKSFRKTREEAINIWNKCIN